MAIPSDDRSRADQVQLELLRAASPERRLALAFSLSTSVIALAREAIRKRHPDWDDRAIGIEFVRVHYGAELAQALGKHLAAKPA